MPGFNQQGPTNQGPMTGRGRGNCVNGPMAGSTGFGNPQSGGLGYGFRRGRGFGQGPGPGWGRGYAPVQGPVAAQAPISKEALRQRAEILESELNSIKAALADLSDD
jgi:hypothetical protein